MRENDIHIQSSTARGIAKPLPELKKGSGHLFIVTHAVTTTSHQWRCSSFDASKTPSSKLKTETVAKGGLSDTSKIIALIAHWIETIARGKSIVMISFGCLID
jgi:hypothetical protein